MWELAAAVGVLAGYAAGRPGRGRLRRAEREAGLRMMTGPMSTTPPSTLHGDEALEVWQEIRWDGE